MGKSLSVVVFFLPWNWTSLEEAYMSINLVAKIHCDKRIKIWCLSSLICGTQSWYWTFRSTFFTVHPPHACLSPQPVKASSFDINIVSATPREVWLRESQRQFCFYWRWARPNETSSNKNVIQYYPLYDEKDENCNIEQELSMICMICIYPVQYTILCLS